MISKENFNKYLDEAQIKRELKRITEEDFAQFPMEQDALRAKYASMVRLLRRARRIEFEANHLGKQRPVIFVDVIDSGGQPEKVWIVECAEVEGIDGIGFSSVQAAFTRLEDFEFWDDEPSRS